jgi:hypothetical protein
MLEHAVQLARMAIAAQSIEGIVWRLAESIGLTYIALALVGRLLNRPTLPIANIAQHTLFSMSRESLQERVTRPSSGRSAPEQPIDGFIKHIKALRPPQVRHFRFSIPSIAGTCAFQPRLQW